MSDLYQEILVKKDMPFTNKLLKAGLIVLLVLAVLAAMFLNPFLLIVAVIIGVVSFRILIPRLDVEYEYLYVNGELDIDVIYSQQRRKQVCSYDIADLEILAPAKSHAVDSYRSQKLDDYTSGKNEKAEYIAVYNKDNARKVIKVELNDVIVNDMRRMAPRKVNLNS